MSLGGYLAIRMAAHDRRIKAVAAVSPPYSADIYWNVTLSGLRRELAALYSIDEREMAKVIDRITLAGALPDLACPLMVSGGGHDHITPGTEAWRIFEDAPGEREIVFYPRGAHDCFNVLEDLKPRMVSWIARQLEKHARPSRRAQVNGHGPAEPAWHAAEAVDPDFADELCGEVAPREWNQPASQGVPVHWDWPWARDARSNIEVVQRKANGAMTPSTNGDGRHGGFNGNGPA